ncbi:GerMN domain-containing protein [Anaeromicropila herbilytica]|uniref:GerMN domain-containing protein n=1 Tax=Anaeromicropila herbilytica TaxID=2785025 RepID=A0A7R7EIM3_9FIRM|nr:GerMN domain-containing protein [Anaeromicropila herbilytica]BCN29430.1 hypothetical protein bsdtb5_07250 [Anaeromicropila herbilytica]
MKRYIWKTSILCMIILFMGCSKNSVKQSQENNKNEPNEQNEKTTVATPTSSPVETNQSTNQPSESEKDTKLGVIADYYPVVPNTQYRYQGEGNEYAPFQRNIDFIDEVNNCIQIRTNNGGTETVQVIQIQQGELSVLLTKNECYYRDNLINQYLRGKSISSTKAEILLMEPLKVGTKWVLPDGRKRYISDTQAKVDTPLGKYQAIEVTTIENDTENGNATDRNTEKQESTTKEYYVKKIGLVKRITRIGDMLVTSTLSERKEKSPWKQTILFYYPTSDNKIYRKEKIVSFYTNDVTRTILEKEMKKEATGKHLPLIAKTTRINSLYLGTDQIVYVDFTKDIVKEMKSKEQESLILQCITNTLGNYYGVKKVYLTIEHQLYQSDYRSTTKGDTLKVTE